MWCRYTSLRLRRCRFLSIEPRPRAGLFRVFVRWLRHDSFGFVSMELGWGQLHGLTIIRLRAVLRPSVLFLHLVLRGMISVSISSMCVGSSDSRGCIIPLPVISVKGPASNANTLRMDDWSVYVGRGVMGRLLHTPRATPLRMSRRFEYAPSRYCFAFKIRDTRGSRGSLSGFGLGFVTGWCSPCCVTTAR